MTCPSCGGELVPGAERCPVCAASVAPRVEGALAADPRLVTPPARGVSRAQPIREIPALRRPSKERTWRDEVQERVRSRRQKRADSGLPLFDGLEEPAATPNAAPPAPAAETQAAPVEAAPVVEASSLAPASAPVELGESVAAFPEKTWELASAADARLVPAARERLTSRPTSPDRDPSTDISDADPADLPLGSREAGRRLEAHDDVLDTLDRAIATRRRATPSLESPMPSLDVDGFADERTADSEVELSAPAAESSPVERPARPFERVQAAAVDLALFSLIAMVVVYFAGRAARVDLEALSASWRWLAAYLGLLAVFYASYFTGTTGQTPGKLVTGLRVVGATGRPPHYPRAAARAVAGFAGILVAGLGCVPMAFDPAARALHDRLFRTRVVRG
jgi:uncharacterized RDD family membrane protein YckC